MNEGDGVGIRSACSHPALFQRRQTKVMPIAGNLFRFSTFVVLMSLFLPPSNAQDKAPLQVVPAVDFAKYSGKWHEVARLPNRFQRECHSDVTAQYTLRPDGRITVLNECRKADGKPKSAKGTARVANRNGPNTKLKVTFFWPFSGNYWIIDIDPGYKWAVVGEPDRKYLWVLSRSPRMDEQLLEELLERTRLQGYDLGQIIVSTTQQEATSGVGG